MTVFNDDGSLRVQQEHGKNMASLCRGVTNGPAKESFILP
jgi:hypothetical protein